MPRLLPSPTAPMLHRIPGGVNFPRVADSPTPPSPTATVDSSPPSSPGQFARPLTAPDLYRRSRAPQRSSAGARRSWHTQRRSLDRTFAVDLVDGDEVMSPPSPGALHRQQQRHMSGPGHRQLPYVNSLPRGRQTPLQLVQTQSDDDDDGDWC